MQINVKIVNVNSHKFKQIARINTRINRNEHHPDSPTNKLTNYRDKSIINNKSNNISLNNNNNNNKNYLRLVNTITKFLYCKDNNKNWVYKYNNSMTR